jgi:hypothetical protein
MPANLNKTKKELVAMKDDKKKYFNMKDNQNELKKY